MLVAVAPAWSLDGSVFTVSPTPAFGEQHVAAESAGGLPWWHTGPDSNDTPNHLPFMVYVGNYSLAVRDFISWESISVGQSSGRWVWSSWSGLPWRESVARFPELARYAPNGPLSFAVGAPPDSGLRDAPPPAPPAGGCPEAR